MFNNLTKKAASKIEKSTEQRDQGLLQEEKPEQSACSIEAMKNGEPCESCQ